MVDASQDEGSLQEEVDGVAFQQIDESIDQLDFGGLTSFEANEDLQQAIEQDEFIINNVASRVGVSKALNHGVKLSSIIKAKASRLNEATAQELLGVVLDLYCTHFSTREGPVTSSYRSQGDEPLELDFVKLSKFFSSKVLAYSPLSWNTLPKPATAVTTESQPAKRNRTEESVAKPRESKRKELGTMVDYTDALNIQRHTEELKARLMSMSADDPISFWDFVLDPDPNNGYNQTCHNIYALTFLVVKGLVKFTQRERETLLKGIAEVTDNEENCQGIVSALSYDRWLQLVEERNHS
ncbi:Nse4 C-terminal DNA repair family protein [Babesia bovis T2Bo]|uniref:Non-structural maintenance of chromosome element 4 C-terminal domain-containing protein n=1 Tax=Babesia bovis TaxID=5865 RepID=A7ARY6_BABBO|nr:Nse4 C-terminal DNA repair family protein [Babesia bovis T2Bo]EDO07305.1 Nse4 C-terminal DNA repair family protein [Babesia bovis T2Bo]|eukprot:XP_001610873.1 hypothetical protein [Babesia bovis T2Bo]